MDDQRFKALMSLANLAKMIDKPIERTYGDTEMHDMFALKVSVDAAKTFLNTHKNKDFVFARGSSCLNEKQGEIREACYAMLSCALMAYMGDYVGIRQELIAKHGATPEEAEAYLSLCLADLKWIDEKMKNVDEVFREKGFMK
jgi:hypothetical protein